MKNYKIIFLLIGFIEITRCDIVTYDLNNRDVPPQKINKTEHVSKMEPTSLNGKVVDDKNLSKRRSYYGEREDDRNTDFDFWQRQNNFDANSNFGNPLRKNNYLNVNGDMGPKFNDQQGNFNWERERNRLSYTSNDEGSLNAENKPLRESYISRNKAEDKLEWEKPHNFYTQSKYYATKENDESRYPLNRFNNREMGSFNGGGNEFRVLSNNHDSFQSQYNKPKDLVSEKGMVTSVLSRFHIPSPFHPPLNNDFATEGTELCKPEKAIIINLKTECPMSKHSRSRVVHKYLPFSPKTPLNTPPSQMIPSNLYYSSDRSTPFYYLN